MRPAYLDENLPVERRIDDLLPRLTLEEKVALNHGCAVFNTAGVPRLGIPELWMDDGPMGLREEGTEGSTRSDDFATAMPATLGLAASWDPELAARYGGVIGEEALGRGKHVMLGPSLNIQRTPLCGRNFEYFGEDPFLAARMAVGYIRGEQSKGVASCAKHFAVNNQEYQRFSINVEVDERALRELYFPAFRASIQEAGVLTVMGAYNKFRGQHCCENAYLLNEVLRQEWGFNGLTISDWNGVHDTAGAALNGMDTEMGTAKPFDQYYLAAPFLDGLKAGRFPMSALDEKVRRHLRLMFALNLIRDPAAAVKPVLSDKVSTREHQAVAREAAEESMVLLKNDGLLPLDPARLKTVAVIGANATAHFARTGGAAMVKAPFEITALEGITNRLRPGVSIVYAQGYNAPLGQGPVDYKPHLPVPPAPKIDPGLFATADAAARAADAVIFVGGLSHQHDYDCEGVDRKDLKLPGGQDELIRRLVKANPRTVVVLFGGGAVEMDVWLADVPALVYAWYPGMEGGNALARVLFGDVNPGGKLPCTFPKRLEDSPAHALGAYLGINGTVTYTEGLFVGYRWFDTRNIEPLFPFGHGLSFTRFEYSDLKISPGQGSGLSVGVEFDVKNVGERAGSEVAQLYVQDVESSLPRPVKELKAFQKVRLNPGETRRVSLTLNADAFSFYDPARKGWVAEPGEFRILVGSSSRDIRLKGTVHLRGEIANNQ
ncbi:MAG: glycoside hydrolase family 3 C-terminal domain-containing protein [Verrucomicrobiota bacterium]